MFEFLESPELLIGKGLSLACCLLYVFDFIHNCDVLLMWLLVS